jgi:hypothetical protein
MSRSEPRQVDVEEYIAEKEGRPYNPQRATHGGVNKDEYQTISTMYSPLMDTLKLAYSQAAAGKGLERHANGKPFMEQPIMEIGRMVGPGYQIGQAMKKGQESMGMLSRGQHERARAELLGAINYLAAAYILVKEMEDKQHVDS